jgi:putative membrane protein
MHALTAVLALAALAYATGVTQLWTRAGRFKGVTIRQAACFGSGILVVVVALQSPIDHGAGRLLAMHMVQHDLLMLAAAPLIVLRRPFEVLVWALPRNWRNTALLVPRVLADPLSAWSLAVAALWLWHLPGPLQAALSSPWMHAAQHASLLTAAVVFWWSLIADERRSLTSLLSLFTTMTHTAALGALMTFARQPWYPEVDLADQQLAGLVLWVPAGLAYPIAALSLSRRWFPHPAA